VTCDSLDDLTVLACERRTKIGIVADLGTLQRIGRIVGKGYARELAFTGAAIDADRASHMGLVNKVRALLWCCVGASASH